MSFGVYIYLYIFLFIFIYIYISLFLSSVNADFALVLYTKHLRIVRHEN